MNKLDKDYQELLQDILTNGVTKMDRTGTGTLSVFGRQIRHKMSDGKFPVITTKKMYFKGIVTELIWFLRGDTNIKYLVDNNCHIWDGDCFSNYLKKRDKFSNKDNIKEDVVINGMNGSSNRAYTKEEFINKIKTDDKFAKKWANLGPIYGSQWRNWTGWSHYENNELIQTFGSGIDQIQNLINDLKTNPDSRRLMVSAWNPADLPNMVLPPCHYGFQVWTRKLSLDERKKLANYDSEFVSPMTVESWDRNNIPTRAISLMWNQRSVDTALGWPYNVTSYGLLLTILGRLVNMIPDELICNLGDCHIYSNHIEGVKEQLTREPYQLPNLVISNQVNFSEGIDEFLNSCLISDFQIENYQSHPKIFFELSN